MNRSLSTLIVLVVFLTLLLVTQALNGGLSLLSFEKQQLSTTLSAYEIVGNHLVSKIERSLRMGKPLDNFIGMNKILAEGMRLTGNLDNISVLRMDGEVLYSHSLKPLPEREMINKNDAESQTNHAQSSGYHHLLLQIRDGSGQSAGFLAFSFGESRLQEKRHTIFSQSSYLLGICTVVAGLVMFLGLMALLPCSTYQKKTSLAVLLFLILGGAQIVCSVYNIHLFQQDYLKLTHGKSQIIGRMLKQDIEFLLSKGLPLDRLINIEQQLESSVANVPELAYLAIIDMEGMTLYSAGRRGTPSAGFSEYLGLVHNKKNVGKIEVGLSEKFVRKAVRQIGFDSLTIVGLSILVIMELLLFLFSRLFPTESIRQRGQNGGALARTAIFLFIFGASLCHSFIPLYMGQLYKPFWGLSKELVLGLPLALEMFGGGLVLIPAGRWIDLRGWHMPFLTGALISAFGMAGSGMADNQLIFIFFRMLTGMGYGMAWMSAQGYILQNEASEHRARQISGVVAGIFSGVICGNGMGAIVADRFGFDKVFFVAAVLIMFSVGFSLCFMRPSLISPGGAVSAGKQRIRSGLMHVFRDSQMMLLFCCSLVPYSIGMVGLLYYVTPIYLSNTGASQSDIGRVIMIFGLCMIFVAPRVSRYADGIPDKRRFIIAGGILASMSLVLFSFSGSLWVMVGVVVLFGLSVSISGASRNVMALALPVTQEIGEAQLMGVYRSVDKLGQALGAVLPPLLISLLGLNRAMTVLGIIYLLLTLVLALRLRFHGAETGSTRK